MPGFGFAKRKSLRWLPIVMWISGLNAQTCIVLSAPTVSPDGTASLDLSLYSVRGNEPAALQWTFQYSSTNIQTLTVNDGPALTPAGKTTICRGDAPSLTCLAVGNNTKTIASGIVAKVTAVLAPGGTAAPIQITSALAVSSSGYQIPLMAKVLASRDATVPSDCVPQLQRRAPVGK